VTGYGYLPTFGVPLGFLLPFPFSKTFYGVAFRMSVRIIPVTGVNLHILTDILVLQLFGRSVVSFSWFYFHSLRNGWEVPANFQPVVSKSLTIFQNTAFDSAYYSTLNIVQLRFHVLGFPNIIPKNKSGRFLSLLQNINLFCFGEKIWKTCVIKIFKIQNFF
jgi:hypothetical protein